jgi:anaerobic magnesium-protoporphyrin IX monomethyl ester cyclase
MSDLQLISPPMITYKGDIFGMIPSPPVGLACLAAYARENGFGVSVLDCFGEAPYVSSGYREEFVRIGLSQDEIIKRIDPDARLVGISVHSGMTAAFCLSLALEIKQRLGKPVVMGGAHASTTYGELLEQGIDYVVIGEGEGPLLELIQRIAANENCANIPGVATAGAAEPPAEGKAVIMDDLPFPAWDLVPLEKYWSLGMSHSPVSGRFVPVITSRGCPFNCAFCSTPKISGRNWRSYSPERVVREIKHLQETLGVKDVFIQDDNFNFDSDRVIALCDLLAQEALPVRLSLPSGVRLEKMSVEVIDALSQGGFHYLCLAPESGSEKVRNNMRKPLREDKLMEIQQQCRKSCIRTGAFIIIGTPGETAVDVLKTAIMIAKLLWHGVDDVSIFIYSPVPGSTMISECEDTMPEDYLGVCWTPRWRKQFRSLSRVRKLLYCVYMLLKLLFQPLSGFRHLRNIMRKTFETKGEMALSRLLSNRLFSRSNLPWGDPE